MKRNRSDCHSNTSFRKVCYVIMGILCTNFFILLSLSASAEHVQRLSMRNVTLEQAIWKLQKEQGISFLYNNADIKSVGLINLDIEDNNRIAPAFQKALEGRGLQVTTEGDVVVIRRNLPRPLNVETLEIRGKVVDEHGATIPGVTVVLKGATIGTATDLNGEFLLKVPNISNIILIFTYVGMEKKEIVYDSKKPKQLKVRMLSSNEEIDEVVVTGIFNKAKESFTGAARFISKEEIKEYRSRNLLTTLSNIDPSFNILENNEYGSDPNKIPEINIRGTTSVPTDIKDLQDGERANLNTPLFILDGFEISLERMMDLDQDEIQSVTILKDASSTAIYGSRGANGVVVLTSVQPEIGKLRVSYSGSLDLEVPDLNSYNLLNAREKLELENNAGIYIGEDLNQQMLLTKSYMSKLKAIEEGVDTYWLSQPLQVSAGQSHRVNLSGGDVAFRYSMSLSYRNNIGVMKGSNRDNFNGSINITYLYKNLKFSNVLSIGMNSSNESQYGSFSEYSRLNPYWTPWNEEGELVQRFAESDVVHSPTTNPLYDAHTNAYDKRKYTIIRENISLEWDISKALKVSGRLGYNKQMSNSDHYIPSNHTSFIDEDDISKQGSYDYRQSDSQGFDAQATLNFAKVFGKHRVYLGINGSLRSNTNISYGMNVEGFTHDRLDFISMGAQYKGDRPSGMEATSRSVGLTANLNYTYNNAYYLDLSYRTDGASSFGENSRFAPFYSAGLGWNINRTKLFMDYVPWVSNFRVRYNYGVTGSLQFAPYAAMTTYTYNVSERYGDRLCSSLKGIGNPDLEWQKTYQHNIGTDISLFNSFMSLDVNYYHKKTDGLITQVNLPLSNGYTSYTENMGKVLNQGLDVSLSFNLIRNARRGINWSVRASAAHNRNKLLELSEQMLKISKDAERFGYDDPNYLYRVGESMDALYVVPSLGIDPCTGKEVYVMANGKTTYVWSMQNRQPYGVMQPKINGRLSTSFRWKDFSCSVSTAIRLGANKYNSTLVGKVENADPKYNVDRRVYSQRWTQIGDYRPYKGLHVQESGGQSSRFVQKERTFQGSSIYFDYTFNRKWLKKNFGFSNMSLTYNTNDIFYFSTVRQERGTSYPFSRRHSMSLSITL